MYTTATLLVLASETVFFVAEASILMIGPEDRLMVKVVKFAIPLVMIMAGYIIYLKSTGSAHALIGSGSRP